MRSNAMVAMILAGGRGSRLHDLTKKVAKPAVHFGGKYRIIDFPLSNCANSGINTVGVLTQYESVLLNAYVAKDQFWGLDTNDGGVFVLPPRERDQTGFEVYRGTADAITQNIDFLDKVKQLPIPVILLINKIDESNQKELGTIVTKWHSLLPNAEILPISAKNKFGVELLMKRIKELLPESPAYFDKDQLTDKPAKFFVSEMIREKILLYYDKEIPYSVEVRVEQFKETDTSIHINAVIYVERDSQKGIIIGHKGIALKKVSSEARKALEKFFDKKIYLETFVKVDKDWRSSQRELDSFGYNPE